MPKFLYWSASTMAREIRAGNLSSSELVMACLERIDNVNPKVNAVVQIARDRALYEAKKADKLIAQNIITGTLHGIPISVKDSLDTQGIISTGGTLGRKNHIPEKDATVVARLRAAGAILIAKTNTPELTLGGETNNLIYGRTRNPYDLDRSPGGSSGGSAALIACGGSALELGSDTGGSIREPAHLCGITGIKPTAGRTPRTGHIVPFGGLMDSLTQIGPMARYVEDLGLALSVICGPDGVDPSIVPVPLKNPDDVDISKLRIAYYTDNGIVTLDSNITRVINQTVDKLMAQGLNIEYQLLPRMENLVGLSTRLREAGHPAMILGLLARYGTVTPGPDLKGYLVNAKTIMDKGLDTSLIESIDQAKSQALEFMSHYDAIICPPSHTLARPHSASHKDSFDDWSYLTIYNLLGWPGVSVRAGTSDDDGLPVGVQIVAAPWREDIALALASRIEALMGGYNPPEI